MEKVDYLIVGQGVAGSCFALKLLQNGKSFKMIDQDKFKASTVAVGVYNTVVLKRFALIWHAQDQLDLMQTYFAGFEKLLNQKFIYEIPTYRIFHDQDEITTWKKKSELPNLENFISTEIHQVENENIIAPFGYSEVKQTGRIDLENCLNSFRDYLIENQMYVREKFDFNEMNIENNKVQYKGIEANRIVFSEGYGVKENPYFNYLPIIGVKGEVLKIKTQNEIGPGIWKANNFLMPLDNLEAYTASTYDRDDLSPEPTEAGKNEILEHLKDIYPGTCEVLEHTAGIRPTVVDRRPILGNHHQLKNMFILNGMGTRGTLLAPQMTEYLYDFIEHGQPIDKEADIRRFDKLLEE